MVGASPWQFGLVVIGGSGIVAAAMLGLGVAFESVRNQRDEDARGGRLAVLTETAVGAVLAVADRIADSGSDDTDEPADDPIEDPAASTKDSKLAG